MTIIKKEWREYLFSGLEFRGGLDFMEDVLPLYLEEEEVAAGKQRRRQQSRKPSPPSPIPKEEAREKQHLAMIKNLLPKLGCSCYSQIWCIHFDMFDIPLYLYKDTFDIPYIYISMIH
jgi:hypothetical protein